MTKSKFIIIVVILLVFIVIAAAIFNNNIKDNNNFKVITTMYPVQLIVDNIIKDANNIKNNNITANIGGCIHDYELTPADMIMFENANLIIINGQDMEHFVENIHLKNGSIVDSSANVPNANISSHIWMDVDNYISQIQTIGNTLCAEDEVNKDIYTKNMNEYISKVDLLKAKMDNIESDVDVAIMHDSFRYYEQKGIFNITQQLFTGHEGNYSANEIKDFIEKIKRTNTKVLLVDNETYDSAKNLVDTIIKETNIKAYIIDLVVDVTDNLDEYIIKMDENIQILKEAIDYGK